MSSPFIINCCCWSRIIITWSGAPAGSYVSCATWNWLEAWLLRKLLGLGHWLHPLNPSLIFVWHLCTVYHHPCHRNGTSWTACPESWGWWQWMKNSPGPSRSMGQVCLTCKSLLLLSSSLSTDRIHILVQIVCPERQRACSQVLPGSHNLLLHLC